jgi:hypothetical protein
MQPEDYADIIDSYLLDIATEDASHMLLAGKFTVLRYELNPIPSNPSLKATFVVRPAFNEYPDE